MLYRYSMKLKQTGQVTIDTVAASCGLSRTTVSAVLRGDAGKYRIAEGTAEKVRAAAEALGWKANYFARSLNSKRTGTIGVLFPDVFERFMGETVRGIEEALDQVDCRMLLSTSRFDADEELRAVEAFSWRGVDGLLIAPYAPFSGERSRAAELVAAIGRTPCVVIDRAPDGLDPVAEGYGFIVQADRDASRAATILLAQGNAQDPYHKLRNTRVGFLGFDLAASSLRERRAGYREAAAELGFPPREILLRERNPDSADMETAVVLADAADDRPGAWFVSTEGLALKLAAILEARGRRLGADVRIGRFGSDPAWLPTGLLGLRQPHRQLGRRSTELLFELIEGGPAVGTIILPVDHAPAEPVPGRRNH
ncbi:MAG: hypothetical protein A2Z99_00195 [Treponema sp. GWB1_62_6]|nr:MAG: hypothetical protein A2001_20635 [Treponema sp. GWC1_61_84]OHE63179.1 MAG: hypothetical protein A2Z99_00195 [Treponema sp. GWB1_62_6]